MNNTHDLSTFDGISAFILHASQNNYSPLTLDEIKFALADINLITFKCRWKGHELSSAHNIKKKGGDAWSGGSLNINYIDDMWWLSTFPTDEDPDEDQLNRISLLTNGWKMGYIEDKGFQNPTKRWTGVSYSIPIIMSQDKFIHIVSSFQ